jgi:hypothetical protein
MYNREGEWGILSVRPDLQKRRYICAVSISKARTFGADLHQIRLSKPPGMKLINLEVHCE